jgi:hypothetical protein
VIIDLSGYSFTGKSAYYDLLSGCTNVKSFGVEYEFDLIRAQGGLLDLYQALCVSWSPIRSSEAIRRFRRLVRCFGGQRTLRDRLIRYGSQYDSIIVGFTPKTEKFLNNLIRAEWQADWPFANFDGSYSLGIFKKYLKKFGISNAETVYLSSISESDFKEMAVEYIEDLFKDNYDSKTQGLVLNNCFEPFNPLLSMQLFPESRSIIVDRDPRDIYISACKTRNVNGIDVGGAVIGGGVNSFIDRFLTYRNNISKETSPKVMRTTFENLILKNKDQLETLSEFLSPLSLDLTRAGSKFNLERSRKNLRQWSLSENSQYMDDIKIIEDRLADYCIC